jgi:uncharacterized metal-binding protein YceD (DUF177 family)
MSAEFSRLYRVDTLGAGSRAVSIAADEDERAALARRFDLVAVARLAAEASLIRSGTIVTARGTVSADVVQACVASGEPVEARVEEPFEIEFHPQPQRSGADEEIELAESELDVVFYDGAAIDLGDAVAETVSLALDPFPRSPRADEALRAAGVKSEEEARVESSPFAALGALKGKLES